MGCLPCPYPLNVYVVYRQIHVDAISEVYLHKTTNKTQLWTVFRQVLYGRPITLPAGYFWHLYGVIWLVTLTPRRFAFVSPLG